MTPDQREHVYDTGFQAALAGASILDNPYSDPVCSNIWEEGWEDAFEEAMAMQYYDYDSDEWEFYVS